MSASERHGYHVDDAGLIHYDDTPVTWETAEAAAGRRLDRRRSYMVIDGAVHKSSEYTSSCSGCSGDIYEARGGGCRECGYTGRRRHAFWVLVAGPEPIDGRGK